MPDFSTNYNVVADKSIRTNYDVFTFNEINEVTVDALLLFARSKGYSDLYIESGDKIRAKKDGYQVYVTLHEIEHKSVEELAILLLNGDRVRLNRIIETKGINDRFDVIDPENTLQSFGYRLNITGCTPKNGEFGYNIALRTISPEPFSPQELGVPSDIVNKWQSIFQGLVLIIGATGEGKTTTLASLIKHTLTNPCNKRILEFSRPIEYMHHSYEWHYSCHISQTAVREGNIGGQIESYQAALNELVRKNPDIVTFAELTEYESIANGLKICNTGCAMLSSLHANDCAAAVERIIKMFPANERDGLVHDFINNLQILISQRLLRKTNGKRVACFEYLIVTRPIKERLLKVKKSSDLSALIKQIISDNGTSFEHYAKHLLEINDITESTYNDFINGAI